MQEQLAKSRPTGHDPTAVERGQIAALHSEKKSNRAIAKVIGVCRQTVANELARGEINQVRRLMVNASTRVFTALRLQSTITLREPAPLPPPTQAYSSGWLHSVLHSTLQARGRSPDAVVGRAKRDKLYQQAEMVCTATRYSYIEAQLLEIKNIDLLEQTSRRMKRTPNTTHKRMLQG